jgi:uncharacterized protein (TIGR02453 family)
MKKNSFNGFTHETLNFFNEINLNNNRIWFEENRERYKAIVHSPFIELGNALMEPMGKIDPGFELRPEKIISRINRDVRFSRDKSPYRSNVWISYKRPQKEWMEAPAFFFELMPDSYRYGMGFYNAGKSTMDLFRNEMTERESEFEKIVSSISKKGIFSVQGEAYKRKIENTLSESLQEWYQKKNLYLMCTCEIGDELFDGEIALILSSGFKSLEGLYKFLWSIKQ